MVGIAAAALHRLLVVRSIGTDEPGQRRQSEDEHEAPAGHLRDQASHVVNCSPARCRLQVSTLLDSGPPFGTNLRLPWRMCSWPFIPRSFDVWTLTRAFFRIDQTRTAEVHQLRLLRVE